MPDCRPTRVPPSRHVRVTAAVRAGLAPALATIVASLLAAQAPAQPAAAAAAADAALAGQVLDAVNRYRVSRQLPPLQPDAALAALAAEHSHSMAQQRRLSHGGFHDRFDRARRQTCVENLAAGFARGEQVLAGWRASPEHHRNLLDARVQTAGVASVDGHVTWLACSTGAWR